MSNKTGKNKGDRMFKQMSARKRMAGIQKVADVAKQPVTRGELYNIQNTLSVRTDSSLMGVAAVASLLVKNGLCTYEEFKDSEKSMLDILIFIRKSMGEAYKELGEEAKPEDVGSFIYGKAIAFGVDEDLLKHVFGVKPSESRVITPNQYKIIKPI